VMTRDRIRRRRICCPIRNFEIDKKSKGNQEMSYLGRRRFLSIGVAGAAAIAVPSLSRAQSAPIKIGAVLPHQGAFALAGEEAALGIKIALDQVGNNVRGRPVQVITYDDPDPLEAQQNMRKLIQEDKVSAVIGGNNSASGLALATLAAQAKMPTVITGAIVREITGKNCDSHVFRIQSPSTAYAEILQKYLVPLGKKWYFLVGAYAYGQEAYQVMNAELEKAGGTSVGMDATSVGTVDFSSYILKIWQARPDVLVLAIAGADLAAFLKQFQEFGLNRKMAVACHTVNDSDLWAQKDPAGMIVGKFWHYNNPSNSPVERSLNDAFVKATGHPATQTCAMAWVAMRMILAAMESANSLEPAAIVHGLETARPEGVPGYFRSWDHQLISPLVVGKVRDTITNKYDVLTVLNQRQSPAELEALYPTKRESQCKMNSA
jgi:branched-chain amino acid transport system substrate-binding protein